MENYAEPIGQQEKVLARLKLRSYPHTIEEPGFVGTLFPGALFSRSNSLNISRVCCVKSMKNGEADNDSSRGSTFLARMQVCQHWCFPLIEARVVQAMLR